MGFLDSGWLITNGMVVYPENIDPRVAYKFVHEAIYDGHLPITKIIGYHIMVDNKKKSVRSERILERDQSCADDRLSVASNLSKIIVMDYTSPRAHSAQVKGLIDIHNIAFQFSQRRIPILSTHEKILTALDTASLDVMLSTSTGCRDANENFEKIMGTKLTTSRTRYFPIFSYHNIMDFVRVLPFNGTLVQLRYDCGMTDEYLTTVFEKLFELKPDKEWCKKYQEILR